MIHTDLLSPTIAQQFEAWKETPGGRHVLRHAYRLAAPHGARFVRSGRRVAVALLWELLRDRVAALRVGLKRRGVDLAKWDGFSFNNNFRAYVARHIMAHRPEWRGMFEVRELRNGCAPKRRRRVLVIEDNFPPGSAGTPEQSQQTDTRIRFGADRRLFRQPGGIPSQVKA